MLKIIIRFKYNMDVIFNFKSLFNCLKVEAKRTENRSNNKKSHEMRDRQSTSIYICRLANFHRIGTRVKWPVQAAV